MTENNANKTMETKTLKENALELSLKIVSYQSLLLIRGVPVVTHRLNLILQ